MWGVSLYVYHPICSYFNYSKDFKYKPKFNISIEKRLDFNDKIDLLETKYFMNSSILVYQNDSIKLIQFESDLYNILISNGIKFDFNLYKKIIPTLKLELDSNFVCKFCNKECGNYNVYFCPYCKHYICEDCGNEHLSNLMAIQEDEESEGKF